MNPVRHAFALAFLPLLALLAGCMPDIDAPGPVAAGQSPERAQAIAEIRAQAAAGETLPYPDAFQTERTVRLAGRPEPLPQSRVEAIETELKLIAERRAATRDAREIAALEARARELRRLALSTGTEPVRP